MGHEASIQSPHLIWMFLMTRSMWMSGLITTTRVFPTMIRIYFNFKLRNSYSSLSLFRIWVFTYQIADCVVILMWHRITCSSVGILPYSFHNLTFNHTSPEATILPGEFYGDRNGMTHVLVLRTQTIVNDVEYFTPYNAHLFNNCAKCNIIGIYVKPLKSTSPWLT